MPAPEEPIVIPIRYERWARSFALLGLPASLARITVTADELAVTMSWAFRLRAPLRSISGVEPGPRHVLSRGVHGWRGRWLVNGAGAPLVTIGFEPVQRAWMAFVPLRVRELLVSVDDAGAAIEVLRQAAAAARG